MAALVAFESSDDRQMPDVIAMRDLRWLIHNAPRAHALVASLDQQYHSNPYGASWGARKDDRSCRDMVFANPFAELQMRRLLHPDAQTLVAGQTRYALAGRLDLKPIAKIETPALTTQPHVPAHGEFRRRLERICHSGARYGLKTDIRKFYPSVQPEQISLAWRKLIGNSTGCHVAMALLKCEADTGISGLPIGPETSAWLANVLLAQSDRTLDLFPQIQSERWSDDHLLIDGSPAVLEPCLDAWSNKLNELGLEISQEKTVRNWEEGLTVTELIELAVFSQGDLNAATRSQDWHEIDSALLVELQGGHPRRSRLNRMFGALVKHQPQTQVHDIIELMLEQPELWEGCCPRGGRYLARFASEEQRERMIHTAADLDTEGVAASEQIVHLIKAATSRPDQIPAHKHGEFARSLLRLARMSNCVPLRGWARRCAFLLDPHHIRGQTIEAGEFDDLHAFEQRWAIALADPHRHQWWLEKQRKRGQWPTTANWRLRRGDVHN